MSSIMIAEDECLVSNWLEQVLVSLGHRVTGCMATSESAVEHARKKKPDLVILDHMLPGKYDGVGASELIGKESGIPILFLASATDPESLKRMREARPAGILFKPFNDTELGAAIDLIIQHAAEKNTLRYHMGFTQGIVDHIPYALFVLNARREIISWNGPAEALFGFAAREIIGRRADTLVADHSKVLFKKQCTALTLARQEEAAIARVPLVGLTRSGAAMPVEMSFSSWRQRDDLRISCVVRGLPGAA